MGMFNRPEFQALRREYVAGAMKRCAHLAEQAARLQQAGGLQQAAQNPADQVDLKNLRQEIHKFRGSGGFYGFAALSGAAAAAEDQLILTLDGEVDRDDAVLATLVTKVVEALQQAAQEVGT